MKTHPGVRIGELDHFERVAIFDQDAEFLLQFSGKRLEHAFTRLNLTAGELPPSRVGLAFGALGKEERTIRAAQDAYRHLDRGA